jgi:hypothetical protein
MEVILTNQSRSKYVNSQILDLISLEFSNSKLFKEIISYALILVKLMVLVFIQMQIKQLQKML